MQGQVFALVSRYIPGPYRSTGGPNTSMRCPFHKGGKEHSPSFSLNNETGAWQCFTCHEAGFLPRLLRMLGTDSQRIDVELEMVRPVMERAQEQRKFKQETLFSSRNPYETNTVLKESLLGVYEWMPTRLVEYDGFDPQLLQSKQIGFDRRLERITYPIRDMYGNLAGISGGATKVEQQPKYLVYQGGQDRFGKWHEGDFGARFDEQYPNYHCESKNYVWNYETVWPRLWESTDPNATLYIVEGYKACLWMIQNGFINTIALMGSSMSQLQQAALERLRAYVVLFLDNDNAGQRGTWHIGRRLLNSMYHRVWVMPYPSSDWGTQPDDYEGAVLNQLSSRSMMWSEFSRRHPQYEQQHNQWKERT